jgi:hypothetical protein
MPCVFKRGAFGFGLLRVLSGGFPSCFKGTSRAVSESINLLNKGFRKKNSRHVIDRDGREDKFDVLQSTSIIQFVCL